MLTAPTILVAAGVLAVGGAIAIALVVRRQTATSPPSQTVNIGSGSAERTRLPDVEASMASPNGLTLVLRNTAPTGPIVIDPSQDELMLVSGNGSVSLSWQAAGLTGRKTIFPAGGEITLNFPASALPASVAAGDKVEFGMLELGAKVSLVVAVT